jgi:hypothetical protein
MKIIVENETERITFKYNTGDSYWYVYINGHIVKHESTFGYRTFNYATPFANLNIAVAEMQKRGLIPKKFDIEELKRVQIIELKA